MKIEVIPTSLIHPPSWCGGVSNNWYQIRALNISLKSLNVFGDTIMEGLENIIDFEVPILEKSYYFGWRSKMKS